MNYLDHDEKNIKDRLNRLPVHSEYFKEKLKEKLTGEPKQINEYRYKRKRTFAALFALFFVLGSTAIAAKLGTFAWLMETIHPNYEAIVEPLEAFCEDNNIRLEIIGAKKYQNTAVVYLSLQDTSGQKRLTEKTDFSDSFKVATTSSQKSSSPKKEITSSFTLSRKLLFFDTESNTLYYELFITADGDSPLTDKLQIGASILNFDYQEYTGEIPLQSLKLSENEPILTSPQHILSSTWNEEEPLKLWALPFGNPIKLNDEREDIKLSNIGIIDGKLHLQTVSPFNEEFGSKYHSFDMVDQQGNKIEDDYSFSFIRDASGNIVNLSQANALNTGVYRHKEYVFSVDTDKLSSYKILYSFDVISGIEGNWWISANLSDSTKQMRSLICSDEIEGHIFKNLLLSPLGIEAHGSCPKENCIADEMKLSLETSSGYISTLFGGGSWENQEFHAHWNVEKPINVDEIIAIHINEHRIPLR